jgi:hypothetical protein
MAQGEDLEFKPQYCKKPKTQTNKKKPDSRASGVAQVVEHLPKQV